MLVRLGGGTKRYMIVAGGFLLGAILFAQLAQPIHRMLDPLQVQQFLSFKQIASKSQPEVVPPKISELKITTLEPGATVERELLLVKVKADARSRPEIMQMVEIYGANIADVNSEVLVIEMTGTREKVSSFTDLLKPFGVVELMRTGRLAMSRGSRVT